MTNVDLLKQLMSNEANENVNKSKKIIIFFGFINLINLYY